MNVERVREARKKATVAFTRFCEERRGNNDCLFCFFEGEDRKYYNIRIERYTGYKPDKIVSYDCGGRCEVNRLYDMIAQKAEFDRNNYMFFTDSDYIPDAEKRANMYQTPCYSIENFYSSSDCFGRIICTEFGVSPLGEDYKKCIGDYKKRQDEFHNATEVLNLWLACQRDEEQKAPQKAVELGGFKVSKLFSSISIKKVEYRNPIDIETLSSLFPEAQFIDEQTIANKRAKWSDKNPQQVYRGKFEMEFLRKILESIIQGNKERTYFSDKYDGVKISISNSLLAPLSMYADTPPCLIDFLEKHRHE